MSRSYNIISADSHVFEPNDLWEKYMEPAHRARAPHVIREGGTDVWVIEGLEKRPIPLLAAMAGVKSEELINEGNYEGVRTGGWDPHARVKDMDLDSMDAEMLYTSMFNLFRIPDPGYKAACFRAYNDWMVDYCRAYPDRLIGIGLIALDDIEAAVQELRRTAKEGLRGAAIPCLPRQDHHYGDPRYDPFWAEAQELEMPLSLHVNTSEDSVVPQTPEYLINFTMFLVQIQMSLATFISYGVLERFPRLKLVSAENDIGWIPTYKARLDHAFERHRFWSNTGNQLKSKPGEYVDRQLFATFMYDKPGVDNRQHIGVDNMMWASDYPHSDATWPESAKFIEWQFGELPAEERRKMICDNAMALYRMS